MYVRASVTTVIYPRELKKPSNFQLDANLVYLRRYSTATNLELHMYLLDHGVNCISTRVALSISVAGCGYTTISGGPEFRALQLNRKLKAFFRIVYTSFCYQNVQKYMAKNIYEMQKKQITAGTCINNAKFQGTAALPHAARGCSSMVIPLE